MSDTICISNISWWEPFLSPRPFLFSFKKLNLSNVCTSYSLIYIFVPSFGGYLFLCPRNRCIDHREGRVHLKPFARQVWWPMGENHRTGDKQHMDIYSWPPLTKKIELSSNQHTGGRRSGKWDVRRLWLHLHDRVVFVSSINWVYNDEPLSARLPNVITLNKTISQAFICIKKGNTHIS